MAADQMTNEERKEYADSLYDELRTLIMVKHFQRELEAPEIMDKTFCVTCREYFEGSPIVHATWHLFSGSTSTPPPDFA